MIERQITLMFNQHFNTVRHHFSTIKEELNSEISSIKIIGTGASNNLYKDSCDLFIEEPKFAGIVGYADFLLEKCKEHKVDFLFVYKHAEELVEFKHKFKEIGTEMCLYDNKEICEALNNKLKTSVLFDKLNKEYNLDICSIPGKICNTKDEFLKVYNEYTSCGNYVAVKFNQGVGGSGYHKVIPKMEYTSLNDLFDRRISLEQMLKYFELNTELKASGGKEDLLVMPYIDGEELSVDGLLTSKGFFGVCRKKLTERIEEIATVGREVEVARKFAEATNMRYPFNLQLRYDKEGNLYVIEVNMRLAGGSYLDNFIGKNLLTLFIQDKLGLEFSLNTDKKSTKVLKLDEATEIK